MRESQSYGSLDGMFSPLRERRFSLLLQMELLKEPQEAIIPRFLLHFIPVRHLQRLAIALLIGSINFHGLISTLFIQATWITRKHMAILKRTNLFRMITH